MHFNVRTLVKKIHTEESIQISVYVSRFSLAKSKYNLSEPPFYHRTRLRTLPIDGTWHLLTTKHHGDPPADNLPLAAAKPQELLLLLLSKAAKTVDSDGGI